MRIAIIADVHSNLAALEAVAARVDRDKPDRVIVAGDTVNRGPRPLECLDFILDRASRDGWQVIRGNHEDYVLREAALEGNRQDWEEKLCRHTIWTLGRLGGRVEALKAWPHRTSVEIPGAAPLVAMHASREGNRVGMYEHMDDAKLTGLADVSGSAFCVGHTHVPFIRQLDGCTVVNAGAVGMPFDRDPRASMAWLDWRHGRWGAAIERVDYDRERTRKDFHATGYLREGGPMVTLILDEFENARPRLGEWHRLFERMVAANHISIEKSIEEMLASP